MANRRKLDAYEQSARQLAGWIDQHLGLLRGLIDLQELGPEASEAVAAVLSVRTIETVALGWARWEALTAGEGIDAEALLVEHLPYTRVDMARRALQVSAAEERSRHAHFADSVEHGADYFYSISSEPSAVEDAEPNTNYFGYDYNNENED